MHWQIATALSINVTNATCLANDHVTHFKPPLAVLA
jgi:hypothetical protein